MLSFPKLLQLAFVFLCFCHTSGAQKPDSKQWYKGNLHTHSLWSDGDDFPEMIIDWYKARGYNFLAMSDHNRLPQEESSIKLPERLQDAFDKYLNRFGDDWVDYRLESGITHVTLKTLLQYRSLFEDENFLLIPSEEITDSYDKKPVHLNATNLQNLIRPQGGNSVYDVMQRNINAVLDQRKETGRSMIVHINHPNYHYAISTQDMIKLKGERFFEVYNGHPSVNNYGDSTHSTTEQMWDQINIAYCNIGQPLMYGLATDDSHHYHIIDMQRCNPGRGWVMVRAESLKPESIVDALEAGDFYSSTGVRLDELSLSKKKYHLKVHAEPGVTYKIQFIGAKIGSSKSSILKEVKGIEATFTLSPKVLFVRARIVSTRQKSNATNGEEVEMAWTQPVQ